MKAITLLLAFILIGCGAKKVNKEIIKTDSIAKEVAVVKTDCTSIENKEIKFDVVSDDVIIEPVDSAKPIEITNSNGKVTKYKNARISHKKRKDNTLVIEEKKVVKNVVDSLTNEIEVNKIKSKKIVYKDQFNWSTFILDLWWLWLLILLAIYIAYQRYKGYLKFPLL
jgi:hypothetical protein